MTIDALPEPRSTAHLPHFFGEEMAHHKLDAILAFSFNQGDLETARSLFASKWWDYRFIHPAHAFFLFADYYGKAVEAWRTKFGINVYARMRASENPIFRIRREGNKGIRELAPASSRTGLFRAMCFADEYGIPYDKWIDWTFEFAFEAKWQRLPTPVQLYSIDVTRHVLERWEEHKRDLLALPTDPRYQACNYVGHATQDAFQDWLLSYIKQRPRPEIPLRNFLLNEPMLQVDRASKVLGDHIVNAALNRV